MSFNIASGAISLISGFFGSRSKRKAARARQRARLAQGRYNAKVLENKAKQIRRNMFLKTGYMHKDSDLAKSTEESSILFSGAEVAGSTLKNLVSSGKNRGRKIMISRMDYLGDEEETKQKAKQTMYDAQVEGEAIWQEGRQDAKHTLLGSAVSAATSFLGAHSDIEAAKEAKTYEKGTWYKY